MLFLRSTEEHTDEQLFKIKQLRQLVEKSDELEVGTDDIFLTKFLYYTNWDTFKAYQAIHAYYDFKLRHPTWVAQHPVQYYAKIFFATQCRFVMPHTDKNGRVLVIFKTVDAFQEFPDYLQHLVEMDDLIFESMLMLPRVQRNGITVICDLQGTTRNFLRQFSPMFMKIVNEKNTVLPFSQRIVHIIQRGFLMHVTSSLFLPFMNKDFKDRIFTHDGRHLNKLREMVGVEYLPAEYGGPATNVLDTNLIFNHLSQSADYLEQLQQYKKR
ncbi:PREDICTED: alpha-tocopherol transfer protein [Drosophila arizonae]|uniref:Alpha-tocopherol transfer protein n=2 Tax=Drosophila arizonae TaxID=7263 RepID=A0ABM1NV31_DROAR|nr:PREDICTED: alpha-tocopherol transfer protein [Drosophila arizonae]XP_017858817.1 PREDICTED: alpha-tocopherol transfer protein [Drosophila arizonae]